MDLGTRTAVVPDQASWLGRRVDVIRLLALRATSAFTPPSSGAVQAGAGIARILAPGGFLFLSDLLPHHEGASELFDEVVATSPGRWK